GWGGVVAVGAGAAVLSSLLTAGIVTATDDSGGTVTTTSSSPAAAGTGKAPVDSGNVTSPNWGDVAAAVEPSVVSVKVRAGQSSGEGSGVILDTSGRILTNNHVVSDAANGGTIQVVLSDGRTFDASIVGRDPATDLAVIKLDAAPSGLKAATLGDSSAVRVGDAVMALGNPLGLSDTVTTGIVSAVDRPVTTSASEGQNPLGSGGEAVVTNAIQTDAAVNPGNSGGALVDSRGRVIGITSSIASLGAVAGSSQSGSIGLGFAIPINAAKDVADQLVKSGTAQHAWMGVSLSEGTATADGAQRQAAILQSVAADGPSAKAGLRTGDAVVAIDGEAVSGADSLVAQIRERKPGTTVSLTVVRDGSAQKVDVTLGTRPTSGQ
uniref:S1C family serine protease n=1 Tax=Kineosporia sp. R_H_3 TaxID=1961848 RepID=UPI001E616984